MDAGGISLSYANKILIGGEHGRKPPRALAIRIFRETGWRHDSIAELTEEQMRILDEIEPWQAPRDRQDEAA